MSDYWKSQEEISFWKKQSDARTKLLAAAEQARVTAEARCAVLYSAAQSVLQNLDPNASPQSNDWSEIVSALDKALSESSSITEAYAARLRKEGEDKASRDSAHKWAAVLYETQEALGRHDIGVIPAIKALRQQNNELLEILGEIRKRSEIVSALDKALSDDSLRKEIADKDRAPTYRECVHRGSTGPNAGQGTFSTPCNQCDAEQRYYLRDSSQSGPLARWWKKGGSYTSDLREAELFTESQARSQNRSRNTDLFYPKEEIEALCFRGVFEGDLPEWKG